jgi:DNA helicase II / ATP-dependent DNA helicase PcrA
MRLAGLLVAEVVDAEVEGLRSGPVLPREVEAAEIGRAAQLADLLALRPQDVGRSHPLIAMERHGEKPEVLTCTSEAAERDKIVREVSDFERSEHHSLAVIAKTQRQAAKVHARLREAGVDARLLDEASAGFSTGIVVCTAHLAKGLEFDRGVIPDADADTYRTEMDRNLLYVACTRAMHRLTVLVVGKPSAILPVPLPV